MAEQKKSTKKKATPAKKTTTKAENEKLVAILSYFLVGMIWYAVDEKMRKSKLATFHVKQALNLLVVSIIFSVVASILGFIIMLLMFIPVIGWIIGGLIGLVILLVQIGLFVLWIFGLVYSFNEEKKVLPIIGQYAEKYLKF